MQRAGPQVGAGLARVGKVPPPEKSQRVGLLPREAGFAHRWAELDPLHVGLVPVKAGLIPWA